MRNNISIEKKNIYIYIYIYYVVSDCSNLISAPDTNLNLVEFDWNSVDSVLIPNKFIVTLLKMYTFGCKKNALEDVSAATLAL